MAQKQSNARKKPGNYETKNKESEKTYPRFPMRECDFAEEK
ncbi:hypothetical protein CCACVL1_21595 [Corchorus capsularis]|uniref:Uncharacterized protein n=1 Tax=Corchorus capsularis TaxID=210143 RepID=A0A1R3H3I1_COCAP|nr:hypothetical protein CCACVL1_21595 [Corchorus capsularis]